MLRLARRVLMDATSGQPEAMALVVLDVPTGEHNTSGTVRITKITIATEYTQ